MKYNLKRLLSLVMALILVLSVYPIDGHAANRDVQVGYGQMDNPLYPDLPAEHSHVSTLQPQAVLGDGSYVTQDEAALLLRDAMVAREASFSINIYVPSGTLDIKNDLFPAAYEFDSAAGAYDGDYLRWSWRHVEWKYSYSGSNYTVTFSLTYYTTATQETALQQSVEQALRQLDTANQTDYQKICTIYDYICTCTDYDHDALARVKAYTASQEDYLIFSAYGAMLRGKAVCQGYACLLYAMCRTAGLPVRVIHNSDHAWNIVKIGDLWYNLDVTWDGQDSENRTNYFLKGSDHFSGHTPAASFLTASFQTAYPISSDNYSPMSQDTCYPHSFDQGVLTVPSCTQTGIRTYTCTTCGFTKTETVAKTGHHHQRQEKAATCVEAGSIYYVCSYCGDTYEEESIPALGHKYEVTVVNPSCTSGGYTRHSCLRCGDYYDDNKTQALGHSWDEGTITKQATESESGSITYTCTTCHATETEEIPPLKHSYDSGVVTKKPTCTDPGVKTYTCSHCGDQYTVEVAALGHTWDSGTVTTAPTEEADGVRTYTCTLCNATRTEPITPVRHHFDQGTVLREATCGQTGLIQYTCTDDGCGYSYTDEIPINQTGHHHHEQRQEPTCTKDGAVTAVCDICGDSYVVEVLPALGHDYQITEKEPTCTETGLRVKTCTRCDSRGTEILPAKGHSYVKTVVDPTCTRAGYTIHTCQHCGDSYQDSQTEQIPHEYRKVTVMPTCTEAGYTEYTCVSCGDCYQTDPVPALGHSYGSGIVTKYATSQTTGITTYTCEACGQEKQEITDRLTNPFTDVRSTRFCYEPVLWAANYGITQGITATAFEPETECTRAHVVTFLWRAAGEPAAVNRDCKFTDVKEGTFYYEAMLWAVENGITNGMTETTFCPKDTCTRAQVVTFLWRAAGKPASTQCTHSFTDVNSSRFYYEAMLWAVEKGITNGDGSPTTFNPEGKCTRGQVVTFLYRSKEMLNA